MGWEGVAAIANNLTKLERFDIDNNKEVGQGIILLGRLPILKKLLTWRSMQKTNQ